MYLSSKPATIIAAGQIATALAVSGVIGWFLGWSVAESLLLGFIIAISSTAVTIKILEEIGELRTETGRLTVGVMIAQDIAIVPMMIVAESLGGNSGVGFFVFVKVLLSIGLLGVLFYFMGKPGKITLPFTDTIEERPDIIVLAALAFCFTVSTVAAVLGLSPAYGAFVAGLIIATSTLRVDAIEVTHPVQSILIFIFFLSIGLLIDINFILSNLLLVFTFAAGVVVIKTFVNFALVKVSGQSFSVALPAGLAMAQAGEFSFILAAIGLRNGILDMDAYKLALSVIALSILISPIWMSMARRFHTVASDSLMDYRQTLKEAYSQDIEKWQTRTAFMGPGLHRAKLHARAARMAWNRRKRR